jgi:hypothetical protein
VRGVGSIGGKCYFYNMDLQTAKELDYLLNKIGTGGQTGFLQSRLERGDFIFRFSFVSYIDYLKKRGFIENSQTDKTHIKTTLEGLMFEGFENQIKKQNDENIRLDKIESRQMRLAERMNTLTFLLVLTSILLWLIEVVSYVKQYHPYYFSEGVW